jgi:hypothetical protein
LSAYVNPITLNYDTKWNGSFFEQCALGNLFCFGGVSTALVAANATATGLSATAQPIIGIYNPSNSGRIMVIQRATVLITTAAASSVSPGSFVWVYATSNTITSGSTPISRVITATIPTSVAKAFAFGTALTGLAGNLTNSLVPFNSTQIVTPQPSTATSLMGGQSEELVDGSWIVEPGNFLGVMGTVSTTTVSCASNLVWLELPTTGG